MSSLIMFANSVVPPSSHWVPRSLGHFAKYNIRWYSRNIVNCCSFSCTLIRKVTRRHLNIITVISDFVHFWLICFIFCLPAVQSKAAPGLKLFYWWISLVLWRRINLQYVASNKDGGSSTFLTKEDDLESLSNFPLFGCQCTKLGFYHSCISFSNEVLVVCNCNGVRWHNAFATWFPFPAIWATPDSRIYCQIRRRLSSSVLIAWLSAHQTSLWSIWIVNCPASRYLRSSKTSQMSASHLFCTVP